MRGFICNSNWDGLSIGIIVLALAVLHSPDATAKVCSVPTLAYPSTRVAVDDAA